MEIIKRLKIDLEEIKRTFEKLEQRSTELQAGITLIDMEDFQRSLRQVSELAERSEKVLSAAEILMADIHGLLLFTVKVFTVTVTLDEDEE